METTQQSPTPASAATTRDGAYHYHRPTVESQCRGWVLDWKRRADHRCDRHGTVVVDGKPYCRRHTPDKLPDRVLFLLRRRRRSEASLLCTRYGTTLADVVRPMRPGAGAITRAQLDALERVARGEMPQTPRQRLLVTSALGLLRKNVDGVDAATLDGEPIGADGAAA